MSRLRLFASALVAAALLASLLPGPLPAQPVDRDRRSRATRSIEHLLADEPDVPEKRGKLLRALRLRGERPVLDGRLDDPAWAAADSIDDLVQWEPENMAPMSERTVLRVAHDDRHLYVAVRLHDREPSLITDGLGRRDDLPPSDVLFVGFDPRHDHLTGYIFGTNPSGVQEDATAFDDVRSDTDEDLVWEVATAVDSAGWTAEFRIPLSQMRFPAVRDGPAVWGLGVRREIHRKGEEGHWVGRPRGENGQVSRWGHVVFPEGIAAPPRVEVIPFSAGRVSADPADPTAGAAVDVGGDLRIGIGSSATLAATFNPDFGQVESDPAVLNLSVFETFFPEKRPFFLEDGRIFIPPYGLFRLFHSRRIGRRPGRLGLESGDELVDRPEETTILGAAKVTGRSTGWTYGALSALTAREYAVVDAAAPEGGDGEGTVRRERLIEPLTSYSAVRLQRDVLGGSSNVGLLATGVLREADEDAFTGGVDYKIRWDRNRFEWNGSWALTRAPGEGGVLTGFGGVSNLGYDAKHLGLFAHFDHFGPDFRVNDLGFLRSRVDRTASFVSVALRRPDPWGPFRRASLFVNGGQSWNGDGLVFDRSLFSGLSVRFRNFWSVFGNVGRSFEVLDDLDTRGGPPIVDPASTRAFLSVNSDSRKTWRADLDLSGSRDAAGGWSARVRPGLRLQPSARLQASLRAGYSFGRDAAQWITNVDADGDGETDHVYGTLRRDVVDVTLRGTYAVHRDMTVQLFLQPFVAVGDYTKIRKLARPRSFDFEPVTLDFDPDFNRKSLRGTLVLRWEYLRGSTLFVVWNASTFDGARPGEFAPFRDLTDAFGGEGRHVFMVKARHWLSL